MGDGTPRVLFDAPCQCDGDVSPDGRFLLLRGAEQELAPKTITIIFNWFEELAAKVAKN